MIRTISIILMLSMPLWAMSAQPPQQPTFLAQSVIRAGDTTLVVDGMGMISLAPDLARTTATVTTQSERAAESINENNILTSKLQNALLAMGIAPEDMQTINYGVYPRQEYDRNGNPTRIVYVVNHSMSVTIREIDQAGAVLDAMITEGATSVSGLSFGVTERESAYQEALGRAVQNARERAQALATAGERVVGDIQHISASYSGYGTDSGYEDVRNDAGSGVPVATGELTVAASVTVVFQLNTP